METTGSSNGSLQLRPLFKIETSLKGKNLLPEGANSFPYEQFLMVWKSLLLRKVRTLGKRSVSKFPVRNIENSMSLEM